MTAEVTPKYPSGQVKQLSADAALASGELIQLPDGRAAYVAGLNARAAGDAVQFITENIVELPKTAAVAVLAGGDVYWVRSTSKAHPLRTSGDFYAGVCVKDAAAADTTVLVDLNKRAVYHIDLFGNDSGGQWTTAATNGLGVAEDAGERAITLAFDAVAEAAMAAIYSDDTVACADGPICELRLAIYDIGDDAALDISAGLANGTHATDFDSVTEAFIIHLDGSALSINAESDDGTTEVAAVDTTVDAVDDTYFECWFDCRDIDDCQLYIDGVNVLASTAFKLDAATGPLKAIVHIEKTNNDTTAEVRVTKLRVRTTDLLTS